MNCITKILSKYPEHRIIVIVPTETLQNQWKAELDERGLGFNTEVHIINTVIKYKWQCDTLVIDEIHRTPAESFQRVFSCVKYKHVLGLTATFERLDGKEKIISKYCPVIDTITTEEALFNGWISKFNEYRVLIDVPDLEVYKQYNKEFQQHYEFFQFDFDLAMKMVGKNGYKNRIAYRDQLCPENATKQEKSEILKNITYHAMGFMQCIQKRKAFINNHPKKIELANRIIEARRDKKIITFSNTIEMAKQISYGEVYSGKTSKKKGAAMITAFNRASHGVINTSQKANEGLDVRGLSVAIILGTDSSKTKAVQRRGRVIRFQEDKIAEVFYLIINNTVESEWFAKAHQGEQYITIDEANLYKVLNNEPYKTYQKPVQKFIYRF